MKNDSNSLSFKLKIEIILAVILFISMMVTCGMYIDIKMNGKTSSLPALSNIDKKILLRTAVADSTKYNDDIIEPIFVGVRTDGKMIAACPDNTARRSIEASVYNALFQLFKGTSQNVEFESVEARLTYIENLKNSGRYMLLGFYGEIPSTAIAPCISESYEVESKIGVFGVKNLFLIPDENEKLLGIAVSADNDVNIIYPPTEVDFGKIMLESYDISEGFSYFEFEKTGYVTPVLTSSFMSGKFLVTPLSKVYGKDKTSLWVRNLLDVFSVNQSLVKEYYSRNESEINYVENEKEILISDDGSVEFKITEGDGIYIDKFLGFHPGVGENYSFSDKIFAVKSIVNKLNYGDNIKAYSIVGVDYNPETENLKVYLKCMVNGMLVMDNPRDYVLEFNGDFLTYARVLGVMCEETDDYLMVLPQKYSSRIIDDILADKETVPVVNNLCAILSPETEGSTLYVLRWAKSASFLEENGIGDK